MKMTPGGDTTMSSPFDRPAPPGDQFDTATHVGALLVIDVLEHVPPMITKASPEKAQDSIRANVYVISPMGTVAEEFMNTLLWPRVIVSRLKQSVGRKVLGVLTGQPNVKRDGKNVPYDLDDPTPQMEQVAVAAMSAHQAQQMQSAPPQQGWGQQPATPPAQAWGQQQPAQQPGGWQQPPAQQGPPPGWGQPPAQQPQQGPPPGWGQQQPAAAAGPWGQQPPVQDPQQQLPTPAQSGPWSQPPTGDGQPPWERDPAQQQASWGGQQ